MRVLLVEDDAMIGESVRKGLRQDGFAVDWVRDAKSANAALESETYDVLLLDLGLPGTSGLDVLARLRARGDTLPVLIVTARDAVEDRVAGLDAGADDYLIKPFNLDELAARVRALQRRHAGRPEPTLQVGDLVVNPAAHTVSRAGQPIALSAREFALLLILAQRPGAVLSRAQLEERLYGWGEEVGSNTIEVHIHALRRKLGPELIHTVRGVGYAIARDQ
jgi:two-component system response regulator QseB